MAAYQALQPRMAAVGATCIYLSKPPAWFAKAVRASAGGPVVVNVKGVGPDDTPVLLSLAELERLTRAAARLECIEALTPFDLGCRGDMMYQQVDDLAILAPDALGLPADGANALG